MLGVGRSERGSGGNRITSHATQTSLTGWCSSLRWRCSNIIYYWDRLSAEQWEHTAEHLKWWWSGDLVYACVIFVWLWMVPQSQPTKGWQPLRWKGVTPHWVWHWHILVLCSHHPGILERCPIVNQQKVKYTDASHHATVTCQFWYNLRCLNGCQKQTLWPQYVQCHDNSEMMWPWMVSPAPPWAHNVSTPFYQQSHNLSSPP